MFLRCRSDSRWFCNMVCQVKSSENLHVLARDAIRFVKQINVNNTRDNKQTLRSRKTTSAFPCCYALDLLGLVDGEMYDKWKVKVDTTQINFKELYFR